MLTLIRIWDHDLNIINIVSLGVPFFSQSSSIPSDGAMHFFHAPPAAASLRACKAPWRIY